MLVYIYIYCLLIDKHIGLSVWFGLKPNQTKSFGLSKHEPIGLCKNHGLVWFGLTSV